MSRLLGSLGLAAYGSMAFSAMATGLVVTVPANSIVLKADAPGQKAVVFLENRSDSSYAVLAGTFYFSVVPTSGERSAELPRVRGVQMVGLGGSPLAANVMQQVPLPGNHGDFMVALDGPDLMATSGVTIKPGSKWPLAEVEFDTTGVKEGSTTYRLTTEARTRDGVGFDMNSFFNFVSESDPSDVLELPLSEDFILVKVGSEATDSPQRLGFRADAGLGGMVFEMDVTPGASPRIEYTDDLAGGTWRALDVQPTQAGMQWRWSVPIDGSISTRFYRTMAGTVGRTAGSGVVSNPAR